MTTLNDNAMSKLIYAMDDFFSALTKHNRVGIASQRQMEFAFYNYRNSVVETERAASYIAKRLFDAFLHERKPLSYSPNLHETMIDNTIAYASRIYGIKSSEIKEGINI